MKQHFDVTNIDWDYLRHQKRELLKVIRERNQPDGDDYLNGIVHLIDSLQDYAVDELGLNEKNVFDLNDEDEPDN
jgi:hypothetical protein